ncbi:AAA family ATPase [Xanthobacteraceae bacterium Astr-EGSB]|uniref:AAA family ATPase n=1 Tax=Astrobacterium formosum TaxID=3069710 RepID=UPI0027B029AF|nr:AAA family ATPase [Xanthobacteraceae bacterium Astr-EGSB]
MNHPRVLAALDRPLDEVLVDAVRRYTKPLARLRNFSSASDNDDADDQPMLPLDDDIDPTPTEPRHYVRPDDVALAALLGRAFDGNRGALTELLNSTTTIEVPALEYLEPTARVLRQHVVRADNLILDGDGLSASETGIVAPGSLAIFTRDGNTKSKLARDGNAEFASALQRGFAVVGIAADAERALPRNLVRMADHRIVVPPLDAGAIAAVIEAITGRRPVDIDRELGRRIGLGDLTVAVRADLGPAGCIERLMRLAAGSDTDDVPTLAEMHGLGEAREWGLNLVADLQAYMRKAIPWSAVDKGCLLSGPPGTGKTTFARALAKAAGPNVHFLSASYSQWQAHREGHLGHVTAAIRDCFSRAMQCSPCILFIDEIDSIPARNAGLHNSNDGPSQKHDDWWRAILTTVLECLDGVERREGVVVVAACNHPTLDPALLRAGRLDKHVRLPLPSVSDLAGIMRGHLGDDLAGLDLTPAAVAARGGTGADVERWVRNARRVARVAQRPLVFDDLVTAIRDGAPDLPADVRRRVAVHESGHCLAGLILKVAQPVSLSIHSAGGIAEMAPEDVSLQTRDRVEKHIAGLLAGRAAEELIFGTVLTGAGGSRRSDLSVATRLALMLEASYGLGELGPIWIGEDLDPRDLLLSGDLRRAVRQTLDAAYATAKNVLTSNRDALDRLADALFARGYLDRREIDVAMAPPPAITTASATPALSSPPLADDPPALTAEPATCE